MIKQKNRRFNYQTIVNFITKNGKLNQILNHYTHQKENSNLVK
jgi:hypothetical protein